MDFACRRVEGFEAADGGLRPADRCLDSVGLHFLEFVRFWDDIKNEKSIVVRWILGGRRMGGHERRMAAWPPLLFKQLITAIFEIALNFETQ